jgi:hypothetical protein
MSLWSFQGARERKPALLKATVHGFGRHSLSKLSSVRKYNIEVDVVLGEPIAGRKSTEV